MQTNTNLNLD